MSWGHGVAGCPWNGAVAQSARVPGSAQGRARHPAAGNPSAAGGPSWEDFRSFHLEWVVRKSLVGICVVMECEPHRACVTQLFTLRGDIGIFCARLHSNTCAWGRRTDTEVRRVCPPPDSLSCFHKGNDQGDGARVSLRPVQQVQTRVVLFPTKESMWIVFFCRFLKAPWDGMAAAPHRSRSAVGRTPG